MTSGCLPAGMMVPAIRVRGSGNGGVAALGADGRGGRNDSRPMLSIDWGFGHQRNRFDQADWFFDAGPVTDEFSTGCFII